METRVLIIVSEENAEMKSKKAGFAHRICGKPVIGRVYDAAAEVCPGKIAVLAGAYTDEVRNCLGDKLSYIGAAGSCQTVYATFAELGCEARSILILRADMPLLSGESLKELIDRHYEHDDDITVLTTRTSGNDRVDTGISCVRATDMLTVLADFEDEGNSGCGRGGFPDIAGRMRAGGKKVSAVMLEDSDQAIAVKDRKALARATRIVQNGILNRLMISGVTIIDPSSVYIDGEVRIGMDTVIYPGSIIEGETVIGEDCMIGPGSRIVSSKIGDRTNVMNSVMIDSLAGDDTRVGPFAYVRPGSVIGNSVKIGDFVEIKKSLISDRCKISHLSYVGDAEIGRNVNIGCGVVTVNYDGKKKNKTVIGDNAFVGCNVNLIAPVTVSSNSYIAAGSTITGPVPEYSLAVARERQVNLDNWVIRKGMIRDTKDSQDKGGEG